MSTIESPVLVLNPHVALAQSAEPQRPKVHVPDPVVDLLQAYILADGDGRHVHPARVPSNAAVGTDVADFEPIGVLERRQAVRHGPRRRRIARGRGLLVERLVRPLVVELRAKDVEAPLLRREAARGRPRGLGLHSSDAYVRAVRSFPTPRARAAP